ncbi:uncharacterized protein [Littorina saxatilis]|uniref:uncharacterized protein n=1 Tax=Littorina saxatilis TaxID=31220 RepID=UPI0038B54374
MANVFDIFSKKSRRSTEVSENEQMNRFSPKTPGAGDSLQTQGVNNDSPFQNKDGAKASGNYAYGADSRQDTQEAGSPFTIPKLKRSKQDLFVEMPTESREWQQEVLPLLTKYFRFPLSAAKFEFFKVSMIQNAERSQKYLDKKKEMRQQGYSERDVAESFAFLYMDDDKQAERICRDGLGIGNLISSTIGHPRMGVQLCKYMDTVRSANFTSGSTGKLIVFKVMKGRVKVVAENRTGPPLEPTPNYDSHMAKSSLDITPASHQQLYELYQIYLYEYGEELTVEPYPRHVLPYAVVNFRYKEAPPSPRMPESPPVFSPRLMSPPIPKFTLSTPKEDIDPEYVIWCGNLRVKDILDCQVKMVSTAFQYKPAHLGTVLNVRDTVEMKAAEDRYFKELSCLRKSGEVYWKGWYINVAELRPRPDSKSQFQRLMNHLGRTNSMAVLKPENDVILLLVPNCSLTHDLGLTRPHHYPVMFHCIFISKQSVKFKSPRYMQKVLFHQTSGSSTPKLDSGQLSPLTINVNTAGRSSTVPASPSHFLSPRPGMDRSASFGNLPQDEMTVWKDVLSAGRSSALPSPNAEGNVPSNEAQNLMRLHRSLSMDWTSSKSPSKSIPLGYDEGFLTNMPVSAHVDPLRLKTAFEIQHQIQDALSPGDPLQCDLPGSGIPVLNSPSPFFRRQDDVEQDDTITSSTSHDPSTIPSALRHRSFSTEASFSPVPSPDKTPSEPEPEVEDLRSPSAPPSPFLAVPKESHARVRSLYLPPPNIPEYKPTPLYEPSPKRSRLEEGSRQSSTSSSVLSSERGAAPAARNTSSVSGLYRTSTPKVQSVGVTHVRSPRDLPLPLPVSPADSSTDRVKSPPASENISTANDMKNFLNASLERKPPSKPPATLSRSYYGFKPE